MRDSFNPQSNFLLYQTPNGETRLEVRLQDETVWLSLTDMSDLFQRDKSMISRSATSLQKANWCGIQLLQILQQLPPTAKPIQAISECQSD